MASRLLHLMRNGWVQRTRHSSYTALFPGGIGLFKSFDHTHILIRQYPPSLTRTALLAGKLSNLAGSDKAVNIVRDPVRMVIKSTTASKREIRRQSLKARLVFGERFIKDVAETVSAKNDVSLSVRLKRAFTDYGKVDRLITITARAYQTRINLHHSVYEYKPLWRGAQPTLALAMAQVAIVFHSGVMAITMVACYVTLKVHAGGRPSVRADKKPSGPH
jgi:hypothetical protein